MNINNQDATCVTSLCSRLKVLINKILLSLVLSIFCSMELMAAGSDFGDAPESYGVAEHVITSGLHLGVKPPDAELASQHTYNAFGDGDRKGEAGNWYMSGDEDGAPQQPVLDYIPLFPMLKMTDVVYSVDFTVSNALGNNATLFGWIDFDGNGSFDANEAASVTVSNGVDTSKATLYWTVPVDIKLGTTFIRLRLTTDPSVTTSTPTGFASDGEVEDFVLAVALDIPPDSKAVTVISGETPKSCQNVIFADDFDDVAVDGTTFLAPNRGSGGGTVATLRNWVIKGGGADTYARIVDASAQGDGGAVYLGNGAVRRISPALDSGFAFDSQGRLTSVIDAIELRDAEDDSSPGSTKLASETASHWGPEPVTLSRSFSTQPGESYRLYFKAMPEDPGGNFVSGAMRVDLPGGGVHFKIPGSDDNVIDYAMEFTAIQTTSTVTFVNYGHVNSRGGAGWCDPASEYNNNPWCTVGGGDAHGNELIIDEVIVAENSCDSGSISGFVFADSNTDDNFDSTREAGISAMTVTLVDDRGTPEVLADDVKVAVVSSGADGRYSFPSVFAGPTYRVEVDATDADLPGQLEIGTLNPLTGITVEVGNDTGNQNFGFDPVVMSCPAGQAPLSKTGYATKIIRDRGVAYERRVLGAPVADGTRPRSTNAALLARNDILIVDLGKLVPEQALLTISLGRNSLSGRLSIATSPDNINYDVIGTYGNRGTLGVGGRLELGSLDITVPDSGARYVRFIYEAGSVWVDSVAYSVHCAPEADLAAISGTVYNDSNNNGAYDASTESGLGSVSLSLFNDSDGSFVKNTSTDINGAYTFNGLPEDQLYRLSVDTNDTSLPDGVRLGTASPLSGVVVTAGTTTSDQNFGFETGEAAVYSSVGEYRFDDCGGDGSWNLDSSGNNNTLIGAAEVIQNDFKAYGCNSVQNSSWNMEVPHHASYEVDSGAISLMVYDHKSIWAETRLISKGGSDKAFSLAATTVGSDSSQGTITASLNGNTINTGEVYYTIVDSGTSEDTQWVHVMLTFGDEGMKLYINGELKGESAYTGGIREVPGNFLLPGLSGYFDEFYILDGQPDAQQVRMIYDNLIADNNLDGSERICACKGGYSNNYCVVPTNGTTGLLELGDMPTEKLSDSGTYFYPDRVLPGYGTVDVTIDISGGTHYASETAIGTGTRQQSWLNENLTRSGPAIFLSPNSSDTASVTYDFNQPGGNVDLLLLDLDVKDTVSITALDAAGNPITDFSGWRYRSGDLSVWQKRISVDASPPAWDAETATVSSTESGNDHRSFGLLTPDTLVKQIVVTYVVPAYPGRQVYTTLHTTSTGRDGEASCDNVNYSEALTNGSPAPDGSDSAYGEAAHNIVSGIQLGANITGDTSAVRANIPGDSRTFKAINTASNDGLVFNGMSSVNLLKANASYQIPNSVSVTASVGGFLNLWVDLNGNGGYEASEQLFNDQAVNAGTNTLSFLLPSLVKPGATYARARFSTISDHVNSPDGLALDGEVEDYAVVIHKSVEPLACDVRSTTIYTSLDFRSFERIDSTHHKLRNIGALPDGTVLDAIISNGENAVVWDVNETSPGSPNVQINDGAGQVSNLVISIYEAGTTTPVTGNYIFQFGDIDGDNPDVSPANGVGDDTPLMPITSYRTNDEYQHYYNIADYEWDADTVLYEDALSDPPKDLFVNSSGANNYDRHLTRAQLALRVAWENVSQIRVDYFSGQYGGTWFDGQGYNSFGITPDCHGDDYSDAPADGGTSPAGSSTAYGEAVHGISPALVLGREISDETQAVENADDASDDGIIFPTLSEGDTSYNIPANNIMGAGYGTLHAWIDFDGNGKFETTEYASVAFNTEASDSLNFSGFNATMEAGATHARFRLTTDALTSADAATIVSDGEVEDYVITIAPAITGNCQVSPELVTPPMNLTPSGDITETDLAGYRLRSLRGYVADVAVSENGTIATVGNFDSYRGLGKPFMFFHAADFTAASGYNDFEPNARLDDYSGSLITPLCNGSFLFTDYQSGIGVNAVWKIDPDGTRSIVSNSSWGRFIGIYQLIIHPTDPDVAYASLRVNTSGTYKIVKFDISTGTADKSFNVVRTGYGAATYYDMQFNPDGNLLISQQSFHPVVRDPDTGDLLATYREVPKSKVAEFSFQSDGKVIVVGYLMNIRKSAKTWNYVARLHPDGRIDDSFHEHNASRTSVGGNAGAGSVSGVAVNDRDEIYIIGRFTHLTKDDVAIGAIAKLNPDGSLNEEFISNSHGAGTIHSGGLGIADIEIQNDGKVVLAGNFQGYNNLYHDGLMRIHGNGVPDTEINNAPDNLAASSGLEESHPLIVAAATESSREAAVPGLNIMIPRGNMMNHAVIYRAGEESSYNEPGYHPDYYGRSDHHLITGVYDATTYDVAGDVFVLSRAGLGSQAYNLDGSLRWEYRPSNHHDKTLRATDVHAGLGLYATVAVYGNTIELFNLDDGSRPAPTRINEGSSDISFSPTGDYLYGVVQVGGGFAGTQLPTYIRRYDPTTGARLANILLPKKTTLSSGNLLVDFYTDVDFYVYYAISNRRDDHLYKYKLVNAAGEPDPNGDRAVLDTSFGHANNPGELWIMRDGDGNAWGGKNWTVDGEGNVYVTGYRGSGAGPDSDDYGANITRIGPVGVDVDNDYILVSSVGAQGTSTGGKRINKVKLAWGSGVPVKSGFDRSDAPSNGLAPDGVNLVAYGEATHGINPGVKMGENIDPDATLFEGHYADGDDIEGVDDEDGVTFSPLYDINRSYGVSVAVTNLSGAEAVLHGWIDFDRNGRFDADEYASSVAVSGSDSNTVPLSWGVSDELVAGDTFARFRLTTEMLSRADVATDAMDGEVEDYRITIEPAPFVISGTVFEDVNYGGGEGRGLSAASGIGVNGATVELYNNAGTLLKTMKTDNDGSYSFPAIDGSYYVRVVNSSVSSVRAGSNGSEVPVMTYRSDGMVAVTNEVGGRNPAVGDAPVNGDASTLNIGDFIFNDGSLNGRQAQSVQPITLSASSANGANFGFNFNTIVNTNTQGQGSLSQFALNSNMLDSAGIRQVLPAALVGDYTVGDTVAVFMIPVDQLANNEAVINAVNGLSIDKARTVIDGRVQLATMGSGSIVIKGDGSGLVAGVSFNGVSDGSVLRNVAVTDFGGSGIDIYSAGRASPLGVTLKEVTIKDNGQYGVLLRNAAEHNQIIESTISGNAWAGINNEAASHNTFSRNSISDNGTLGIDLGADGVTENSTSDGWLNYPEVGEGSSISTNGSMIVSYDFDLDVPANTHGYRVEFFSNTVVDPSGHGEGLNYLGYVDISSSGSGSKNFKGTFNANQTVPEDANIAVTLTEKTGVNSLGATSEFSSVQNGNLSVCTSLLDDPDADLATVVVKENSGELAYLEARDENGDPITYVISGGADGNQFAINPVPPGALFDCVVIEFIKDGGVIGTKNLLATSGVRAVPPAPLPGDYESPVDSGGDNTYDLMITATDVNGNQVTKPLTVVVQNVNEKPRIMTAGSISFVELQDSEKVVVDLEAYDPDEGDAEGAGLTYSISGGVDSEQFSIDSGSGEVRFASSPDFNSPSDQDGDNLYEITVRVNDDQGYASSKSIVITVTDDPDKNSANIRVKALLQGAFDAGSGLMRDDLRSKGLLPVNQPYNREPFIHEGAEQINLDLVTVEGDEAIVDWVLLELRTVADPTVVAAAKAALIQRNGEIVDAETGSSNLTFAQVDSGQYYLSLRHRNHLGVMSEEVLTLGAGDVMVDFAQSSTRVKGEHTRLLNRLLDNDAEIALLWVGDINQDNRLIINGSGSDLNPILNTVLVASDNTGFNSSYQIHGYQDTDLNMDGVTLYMGPANDANVVLGNILLHPANDGFAGNFVMKGGM